MKTIEELANEIKLEYIASTEDTLKDLLKKEKGNTLECYFTVIKSDTLHEFISN